MVTTSSAVDVAMVTALSAVDAPSTTASSAVDVAMATTSSAVRADPIIGYHPQGFSDSGGECVELDYFPNATIAEYGEIGGGFFSLFEDQAAQVHKIKAEIHQRGPVAATVNADPLRDYEGGILDDEDASTASNHIVSIVGFGKEEGTGKEYWIIRNSWGEYWGEMGFARIAMGKNMIGIEDHVAWATPGTFTTRNAMPCSEDGKMCGGEAQGTRHGFAGQAYVDPSAAFLAAGGGRAGLRVQE